jgi:hypothetical protein
MGCQSLLTFNTRNAKESRGTSQFAGFEKMLFPRSSDKDGIYSMIGTVDICGCRVPT